MATQRTPLARRRRTSARVALYASLVAIAGGTVALLAWLRPGMALDETTEWVAEDFASHRAVQLLREYIAIDTSHPGGEQLAGALWFAGQLRGMGLEPVVERVGSRANVWAVVEGEREEAIVLHHHIDVDPVPVVDDWRYLPFEGVIDGPWLYGRGAFDMKSVAVAQIEAVRALLARGERPERSVILLGTADEEVGSDLGMRWILREHPELVERFGVVLTEGGAVEAVGPEDAKHWGTEIAQARLLRVVVCGRSAEDLRQLEEDLALEVGLHGEPRLVPEVERFLAGYAASRGARDLRERLADPRVVLRDRVAFQELPTYVRSFFVDTARPQGVTADPGGGHQLRIFVLLLPGADPDEALAELVPSWLTHGFTVQVHDEGGASRGSSPDHWAFAAIDELMRHRHPDVDHGPLYLPQTFSDARFVRAAGVPAFGFSPFNILTVEVNQLRNRSAVNERIALPGYLDGIELYSEVLHRLASDTD